MKIIDIQFKLQLFKLLTVIHKYRIRYKIYSANI